MFIQKLTIHSLEVLVPVSCFPGVGGDVEAAQRPGEPLVTMSCCSSN
jgi:hypothetical protein